MSRAVAPHYVLARAIFDPRGTNSPTSATLSPAAHERTPVPGHHSVQSSALTVVAAPMVAFPAHRVCSDIHAVSSTARRRHTQHSSIMIHAIEHSLLPPPHLRFFSASTQPHTHLLHHRSYRHHVVNAILFAERISACDRVTRPNVSSRSGA